MRDLARLLQKEIELEIRGEKTDLDKSILDALSEPLAHLVRNASDHGIESASERQLSGKPARATIQLNAYHDGDQVVIEISDDGRGLDRDKIGLSAIKKVLASSNGRRRYPVDRTGSSAINFYAWIQYRRRDHGDIGTGRRLGCRKGRPRKFEGHG